MGAQRNDLYTYFRYALPQDAYRALLAMYNPTERTPLSKEQQSNLTFDLGSSQETKHLNGVGEQGNSNRLSRYKLYVKDFDIGVGDLELEQRYSRTKQDLVMPDNRHIFSPPSLFNLLLKYAHRSLNHDLLDLRCQFNGIFHWQETTHILGQDLFTCAAVAYAINASEQYPRNLAWNRILPSDYPDARGLFGEGVGLTENHFHLWGSSCTFDAAWALIMNKPHVIKGIVRNNDMNLTEFLGQGRLPWLPEENEWELWLLRAAIIRAYLFSTNTLFTGYNIINEDYGKLCSSESNLISALDNPYTSKARDKVVPISDLRHYYGERLQEYSQALCPKAGYDDNIIDYAYTRVVASSTINSANRILVGERNFLINSFRRVFASAGDDVFTAVNKQLLYLYLLIKARFRGEMVQSNGRTGFNNFSKYDNRKTSAFACFPYSNEVTHYAINAARETQNVNSHELRIVPKLDTCNKYNQILEIVEGQSTPLILRELAKQTNTSDNITINGSEVPARSLPIYRLLKDYPRDLLYDSEKLRKLPYHFVWHFTKRRDIEVVKPSNLRAGFVPKRNSATRETSFAQAQSIASFLDKYPEMREVMRGIDGCSEEIGCRPEVMACAFRYLSNYKLRRYEGNRDVIHNLHRTFHVGEGFLDIADGLRAIDEARYFLFLRSGDRLGHATALGLDVYSYYEARESIITLSRQDMLDTIVWVLQRAPEWGIEMPENLRIVLTRKFHELVDAIYYHCDPLLVGHSEFRRFYDTPEMYFASWHLRGDEPEAYYHKTASVIRENVKHSEWASETERSFYCRHPWADTVRDRYDCAIELYYQYHFNPYVRQQGYVQDEYRLPRAISKSFFDVIHNIQQKLREKIYFQRIGIETNPTSNRLISTFETYNKHPIFTMCEPMHTGRVQLSVSINTDDQGVFETSLENEYTLILAALLEMKDNAGSFLHPQHSAHEYIRSVMRMAARQSFRADALFDREQSTRPH